MMSTPQKKQALKAAAAALSAKDFKQALTHCKQALQADTNCYEAYVYIGKAAFSLGEFDKAELSYQKATEINEQAGQAWQGLSQLYHDTQQWAKAAEADQVLVDLAHRGEAALAARLPVLMRRLGEAYIAAGQLEEAELALREVLKHPLDPGEKLSVLALLADVQLKEDVADIEVKVQQKLQQKLQQAGGDASKVNEEAVRSSVLSEAADEAMELDCDHATATLKDIVCSTPPFPPYAKYHDTYLRRLRRAVNVAAPGSMDRHNRRVAVLEVCRAMMEGRCASACNIGQGCASPYAFETALRLLEIEEEIAGVCMPRSASQEQLLPGSGRNTTLGSMASFSGALSPRSGFATPTTAAGPAGLGMPGALLSPAGSFFGSLAPPSRVGSLLGQQLGQLQLADGGSGPPQAPATPKREISAQQLSDLVRHPMAAAAAAAGGTMAAQERDTFPQLCAEASEGRVAEASDVTGLAANGTSPLSGHATPEGSLGGLATAGSAFTAAGGLSLTPRANLRVAVPGNAALSRRSSAEWLASPHVGGVTPRASTLPATAPLILSDRESIAKRLMHAFPWNNTAQVHVAMALRRRESYVASDAATIRLQCDWQGPGVSDLSCSALAHRLRAERPRQLARRAWLINLLAKGLLLGAPVVSAMIALAELRLEAGDAPGALEAAKRGIKFVFDRSKIHKERARHAALVLNLLAAQALLASGELTDAGRIFVRLAGHVSEGEVSFGSEAIGMPATSIRQQAIRGLAQVALARGDKTQALHHYGELVSKALMGRGSAEHWAYAEYGWLLFQEGNADAGRYQLETALDVLARQGNIPGGDVMAAGYHYKLARIYWALGGEYKTDKEHYCHAHLLDAAAEDGPQQAEAFAWLGHWYQQVAADDVRAKKCYQRALALDPTLADAGDALCDLLQSTAAITMPDGANAVPATSALEELLEEMLARAPDAQWAKARLARLQLQLRQYQSAVTNYQAAIRASPRSAELWEGLAAAYQALGRHASALKSYGRALELDSARPYALMSAGALEYMAGGYESAAKRYRAALQLLPHHPAALLGLAEVLLSAACKHIAMGAAGAAAVELAEAASSATAAVTGVQGSGAAANPDPEADGAASPLAAAGPGRSTSSTNNQQAPVPQAPHSTNLVTGWKLLGDILLQQHLLQPIAAAASSARSNADAAVTDCLLQLARQRDILHQARTAYLHALHLKPATGELWGDVALCYSHEAQLMLQLHANEGSFSSGSIAGARAAAVAMARGGLRLSPTSSWLWGVLAGATAASGDTAAAEYCYSRALALDPKDAMLWVQLGRLYSKHGSAELAEQCYESARGAEPTLVPVWEAMASTAAATRSVAGTAAAAAAAEHAVGLGGSPESWLEYATTGLRGRSGVADSGALLACAAKSSACHPLMLPPHAALAAVLESRGQYDSAAAALRFCLALLQAGVMQGVQGLAALGMSGLSAQRPQQLTHQLLLLQPGDLHCAEASVNPESVAAVLELSLARNLTLSGNCDQAMQLYHKLEGLGALDKECLLPGGAAAAAVVAGVYDWICYGFAAQKLGQAELSQRALEQAVQVAELHGNGLSRLHAVVALLQFHLQHDASGLESGFSLLLGQLPQLTSSRGDLASGAVRAWLSLVVAAAAAGQQQLRDQVVDVLRQFIAPLHRHIDMAWVECELLCVQAATQATAGSRRAAVRQLAAAVHTCPWHTPARLRLASLALAARPRDSEAVHRSCPVLLPHEDVAAAAGIAALAPGSSSGSSTLGAGSLAAPASELPGGSDMFERLVLQAVSTRATALSGQVATAVAAAAGQEVARLQQLLHALPNSPDVWYCLALAAVMRAVGDGQAAHFRAAHRCCLNALSSLEQLAATQKQQSANESSDSSGRSASSGTDSSGVVSRSLLSCNMQHLQYARVRLMVAVSECCLHSRLPGCHDAAHQWAMDALATATAAGTSTATAHRQVGRMLAVDGFAVEAEMAYRQAVAASAGADAGAVLELAKLLSRQGRQQEASALLHGIWENAAAAVVGNAQLDADGVANLLSQPTSFVEAAALEEALWLADLGQWDAARFAAAAGLKLAQAAGETASAAAELVTATVALQAAAAAPADSFKNLLLEARWAASAAAKSGLAMPGTTGTAAAGVGAAVLAQVELARAKPERAYEAVGMSFAAWVDQAVPAQVLVAAGSITGQLTDCAAAVHTAPWLPEAWENMRLAAVASR